MILLLFKSHINGYTKKDGTYVAPHDDSRHAAEQSFEDDMAAQAQWLDERAREHGFTDVGHLLTEDPGLFAKLAESWREAHPSMAKAIDQAALDAARRRGWADPTPAQAAAGNYAKPRVHWQGLEIAIENPVGSVRRGKGWETQMTCDYGYVCRSEAVDGDEVDVYLGPDLETAENVYVVHQRKKGAADAKEWREYDEDKCMLGFESEAAARAAYLKHYDDPRFLGPVTAMPVEQFVAKVRATRERPAMIKALFLKAVDKHDKSTSDMFGTHAEERTRADGVVQKYHVKNDAEQVAPANNSKVLFAAPKQSEEVKQKGSKVVENSPVSKQENVVSDVDSQKVSRARQLAGRGFEDMPDTEMAGTLNEMERLMKRPLKDSESSFLIAALKQRREYLRVQAGGERQVLTPETYGYTPGSSGRNTNDEGEGDWSGSRRHD